MRYLAQSFAALVVFVLLWEQEGYAVDLLSDDSYQVEEVQAVADPLEPMNRAIFAFNDKFYLWVMDPVATGYSNVLPQDIRGVVDNFFSNLAEPVRSANCLLQGRFRDSGLVLSRFAINSVFGVFGLADPAGHEFEIAPVYATFGQTLSIWGVGDGFYLVAPLFGPSTARDFAGTMVDSVTKAAYYPHHGDDTSYWVMSGIEKVNATSLHLGEYQDLKSLSFDPYVAFRNGYFQMRTKQRAQGSSDNAKK